MRYIAPLIALLATPAFADDPSQYGTTNPDEMTWQRFVERAEDGETGMVLCSMGYALTKSGDHDAARTLFLNCAEDGYTGAMTWMSQLDNNGLGAEYDPDAAAEWDRRAAALGDPVGKFNYGLDLLRGHGVEKDEARGRQLVAEAAQEGLPIARRLEAADYDLDEVTPDADNWKYAPVF
ncbi:sel1 repeat family protein [Cognatiyoonia sp. IB215446]|uniref:tetratricopeptide repeat protein n=1 Tax=Cognatiyoonia sp. IB215446 TaxID=3097355 RepID=UPI002A0DB675|nr:sel1 repeat family protein [Cognatiyoonia sp. IB215446]MDX8348935.1 sel1 repeat family protein [Cognatiyoonia sp. IB215446]